MGSRWCIKCWQCVFLHRLHYLLGWMSDLLAKQASNGKFAFSYAGQVYRLIRGSEETIQMTNLMIEMNVTFPFPNLFWRSKKIISHALLWQTIQNSHLKQNILLLNISTFGSTSRHLQIRMDSLKWSIVQLKNRLLISLPSPFRMISSSSLDWSYWIGS